MNRLEKRQPKPHWLKRRRKLMIGEEDAEQLGPPPAASDIPFTPSGGISSTNVQAAILELDAEKVAKAGDTMTGFLTLNAEPTSDLHAATKKYVDDRVSVAFIGDSPPASPVLGQLWWESDTGNMYIYYSDGTSTQWVPVSFGPTPLPPAIALTANSVAENSAIGTVVGTVFVAHTYTGTPSYTLTNNAGGAFTLVGNSLQTAAAMDFETASSYNITLAVSGITPSAPSASFTVNVTNVAEPVIVLSATTISEDAAIGDTIGTLSVTSGYTGTPVFTLVDSAGGKFSITGNLLKVAAALDYETAETHNITVAVSGTTPASPNKVFSIVVLDVEEAAVPATLNPADKAAGITLSPDLLTATGGGASVTECVRSTVSQATGKRYCKFTVAIGTGWEFNGGLQIGALPATSPIDPGYLGGDGGFGYACHGTVFCFNGTMLSTTMPVWTAGDVVEMAVNLDTELAWFKVNSGGWNGDILANQDPENGIGGLNVSPAVDGTTPLFPAIMLRSSSPGNASIAIDLTGVGAVTGFEPWGSGAVPIETVNFVDDYSASPDAEWVNDTFTIYYGSTTLICANPIWGPEDEGKFIVVSPIPFGSPLLSTIVDVVSATEVTLAHSPPENWINIYYPTTPPGSMVARPNVIVSWGATNHGATTVPHGFNGQFEQFRLDYQDKVVKLIVPAGNYLISNGNFTGLFRGIRGIIVEAAGATFCGDTFQLGVHAQQEGPGHSAYVETVAAGSYFVNLIDPTMVDRFVVGDYTMMSGFDMQQSGYPTNQAIHEYLKIVSIDDDHDSPTYGRVTFLTPLQYGYKSTWPLYVDEQFTPTASYSLGGPATLYAQHPYFDHTCVINGLRVASGNQYGASGLDITYNDVIFEGHGQIGPHPTMAKRLIYNNCQGVNQFIEVDKLCEYVEMNGCEWGGLTIQSSSLNEVILDNTKVHFSLNGTPRKMIIRNGCEITTLAVGPSTYGYADVLEVSDSTILNYGSDIYNKSGFEIRSGDAITAGSGIDSDYTMVSGVITVPASMHYGTGRWAITGGRLHFYDANLGSLGLFTITDVVGTGPGAVVQVYTDWTRFSGGFPPSTYVDGVWLVTHNAKECTFDNVTGCLEVEMLSNLPTHSLGSRYKYTFDGSITTTDYWQLSGRIVKVIIDVSVAYVGSASTVIATLDFGNAVIKMSDGSAVVWDQFVNLKTTGIRTFDVVVDPYPTAWTGGVGGDTLLGMTEALWSAGNFRVMISDISGATTLPVFTVEVECDHGL